MAKSFNNPNTDFNPVSQFISQSEEEREEAQRKAEEEAQRKAEEEAKRKAEEEAKRNKARETKSKHVQLLVKPSVYKAVQKKAEAEGLSVNSFINNILEAL